MSPKETVEIGLGILAAVKALVKKYNLPEDEAYEIAEQAFKNGVLEAKLQ